MAKNKERGNRDSNIVSVNTDRRNTLHAVNGEPDAAPIEASPSPSRWSRLGSGEQIGAVAVILLLMLTVFGSGWRYLEESAAAEKAANAGRSPLNRSEPSLLSAVNPFVEPPPPTPTPQLSKEYIYAGSRMLAVEDANANAAPPADLAVWRPATGMWYVLGGPNSAQTYFQWGGSDDLPVPGDFDGDGKTDFSAFRKSTGYWYISYSSNGHTIEQPSFGLSSDKMAQADYDGDGRTDMAVFRSSTGYWYIKRSSDQTFVQYQFGAGGHTPVPADYDGDGRADIAVWYNASATFEYLKSSSNYTATQTLAFGQTGDKPVVGDYDGDGRADAAIWRNTAAQPYQWHVRYSSDQTVHATTLGDPETDIAVQNDYDGDGKTDMAIWRPANGTWYIQQSSNGQGRNVQWGQAGDYPVPAFYRR